MRQVPSSGRNIVSPPAVSHSQKQSKINKQRPFTPKKTIKKKSQPKQELGRRAYSKQLSRPASPFVLKSPKINIKMDFRSFNIYNALNKEQPPAAVGDRPKKRIHKKTISCLINRNEQPKTVVRQGQKGLHNKTKSQAALEVTEWDPSLLMKEKTKESIIESVVANFAYCNRRGYCPEKEKINQDTYISIEGFLKKGAYLFGVCDGHGTNGHYVAEFVREILPEQIDYFYLKQKRVIKNHETLITESMKRGFSQTAKELKAVNIDTMYSGSTTCLVYVVDHDLYCTNLGDSRAVLFSKVDEQWAFKQLSEDHKGQNYREARRIEANGGRIFSYDDEDGQPVGPMRVWLKDKDVPGLAMTRSFGDFVASSVGVISQPDVTCHKITKNDKFIVLASDGLWEFIENKQVMKLVIPAFIRNDVKEAVKQLEAASVQAWKREDDSIDDITITVIFFKYY